MALIRCPECGKEISSEAKTCIHCGLPITEEKIEAAKRLALHQAEEKNEAAKRLALYQVEQRERKSKIKWSIIMISAVVGLCALFILIEVCIDLNEKHRREEAERIHSEAQQANSEFEEWQREQSEIEQILSELEDEYS